MKNKVRSKRVEGKAGTSGLQVLPAGPERGGGGGTV